MLEKDFVPYEPSLALRELGFDEPCFGYYEPNKVFNYINWEIFKDFPYLAKNSEWQDLCGAPTFSQAFRWFRETYNIDAWVQPFVAQSKKNIPYLPDESYGYFIFKDGVFVCDKVDLLGPEEAELACLIKLIEIAKENKQ